jgi:hypothetical protein
MRGERPGPLIQQAITPLILFDLAISQKREGDLICLTGGAITQQIDQGSQGRRRIRELR